MVPCSHVTVSSTAGPGGGLTLTSTLLKITPILAPTSLRISEPLVNPDLRLQSIYLRKEK
jgi:hypothetical protein